MMQGWQFLMSDECPRWVRTIIGLSAGVFLHFIFKLIPWKKIACAIGRHDWTDIHEDRVTYVNFSPEHYTVCNRMGCMRPGCHAVKDIK